MDYKVLFKEENEKMKERYELAMNRVTDILKEDTVKAPYNDYFKKVSSFILQIKDLVEMVQCGELKKKSLKELQALNESLYKDITLDNYNKSYANPEFTVKTLGEKYAAILS